MHVASFFGLVFTAMAILSVLPILTHGNPTIQPLHPKLKHLSKRELAARDHVLATLPEHVRRDIEARDPDEYELDYEFLLERDVYEYDERKRKFIRRDGEHGPGIDHCSDSNTGPAMTYDDGPYTWNRKLSDMWADAGHHITFFININNFDCAYNKPHVGDLKHALQRHHQIGSHTGTHRHLTQLTHAEIDEQIQLVETFTWDTLGLVPRMLRPPYGEMNDEVKGYLESRWGLLIIQWSLNAGDADGVSPEESINRLKGASNNDIILNHETHQSSVDTVATQMIDYWNSKGVKSRTVKKCINQGNAYKVRIKNANRKRDDTWSCPARNVPEPGTN